MKRELAKGDLEERGLKERKLTWELEEKINVPATAAAVAAVTSAVKTEWTKAHGSPPHTYGCAR